MPGPLSKISAWIIISVLRLKCRTTTVSAPSMALEDDGSALGWAERSRLSCDRFNILLYLIFQHSVCCLWPHCAVRDPRENYSSCFRITVDGCDEHVVVDVNGDVDVVQRSSIVRRRSALLYFRRFALQQYRVIFFACCVLLVGRPPFFFFAFCFKINMKKW